MEHNTLLEWVRQDNSRAAIAKKNNPGDNQDIHLALGGLSDKLHAVIALRYYGGRLYAEVNESLGIPIGTVKSRLDLGFRKLRQEPGK